VDEVVDMLLTEEYYLDLSLPRLTDREYFERNGLLPPRQSLLDGELEASDDDDEDDDDDDDDSDEEKEGKDEDMEKESDK
jgi:hypothetical protein